MCCYAPGHLVLAPDVRPTNGTTVVYHPVPPESKLDNICHLCKHTSESLQSLHMQLASTPSLVNIPQLQPTHILPNALDKGSSHSTLLESLLPVQHLQSLPHFLHDSSVPTTTQDQVCSKSILQLSALPHQTNCLHIIHHTVHHSNTRPRSILIYQI